MSLKDRIRSAAVSLLRTLLRKLSAAEDEPVDNDIFIQERLSQLVRVKAVYLQKDLSLDSLALMIGTNRSYLSHALASLGGFSSYINGMRLAHAEELFAQDPRRLLTLAEVAELSGFPGERVMNASALRLRGVTAAELRIRVLKRNQAKKRSTSLMASGRVNTATRS